MLCSKLYPLSYYKSTLLRICRTLHNICYVSESLGDIWHTDKQYILTTEEFKIMLEIHMSIIGIAKRRYVQSNMESQQTL